MEQKTRIRNLNSPYLQYRNTEEWVIIEHLLNELENNQDIELKTAREYVIGYLVAKLRNKDLLTNKTTKIVSKLRNSDVELRLNARS